MISGQAIGIYCLAADLVAALDARRWLEIGIHACIVLPHHIGIDAAIERGKLYLDSGAEALFIEAPQNEWELEQIAKAFPDTILIANMIEGGRTPNLTSKDLENLGFDIVFWPCTLVYTVTKALGDVLRTLRDEGTTNSVHDKMLSFSQFNSFIGLDAYNELDKKYK